MRISGCVVDVSGAQVLGVFANAFRIVRQEGNPEECLLDFLVYSEVEGRARVVSRVRVRTSFLPDIRDRLGVLLKETSDFF